jgi:hypothetical protein
MLDVSPRHETGNQRNPRRVFENKVALATAAQKGKRCGFLRVARAGEGGVRQHFRLHQASDAGSPWGSFFAGMGASEFWIFDFRFWIEE